MFITNDSPNVSGIILAGSADFKNVLGMSDLFDGRLAAIVLNTVDVSYGGENGFNQVRESSPAALSSSTAAVRTVPLCASLLSGV